MSITLFHKCITSACVCEEVELLMRLVLAYADFVIESLLADSTPVPLTPDYGGPIVRYADGVFDLHLNRYLSVREGISLNDFAIASTCCYSLLLIYSYSFCLTSSHLSRLSRKCCTSDHRNCEYRPRR